MVNFTALTGTESRCGKKGEKLPEKIVGRRQKAEGSKSEKLLALAAYCLLLTAYCFPALSPEQPRDED
jgi:hypothetical protein